MTNRNWWDNWWDRPYKRDDPQPPGEMGVGSLLGRYFAPKVDTGRAIEQEPAGPKRVSAQQTPVRHDVRSELPIVSTKHQRVTRALDRSCQSSAGSRWPV